MIKPKTPREAFRLGREIERGIIASWMRLYFPHLDAISDAIENGSHLKDPSDDLEAGMGSAGTIVLPEVETSCRDCGGYVLILAGDRAGYCFTPECGSIVRRPWNSPSLQQD